MRAFQIGQGGGRQEAAVNWSLTTLADLLPEPPCRPTPSRIEQPLGGVDPRGHVLVEFQRDFVLAEEVK